MGHYGNPHEILCGVFSTKEKAEQALEEEEKGTLVTYSIEELEVL
jgi:hypothetical protein